MNRQTATSRLPVREPVRSLLLRIASEIRDLLISELRAGLRDACTAALWTFAAAVLLLVGALVTAASLTMLLALWIPTWLAAAALATVLLGSGLAVLLRARRKFPSHSATFPRTRQALLNDLATLARQPLARSRGEMPASHWNRS